MTGKSTVMKQLLDMNGERVKILSDDEIRVDYQQS
jgi:hypothetical protein